MYRTRLIRIRRRAPSRRRRRRARRARRLRDRRAGRGRRADARRRRASRRRDAGGVRRAGVVVGGVGGGASCASCVVRRRALFLRSPAPPPAPAPASSRARVVTHAAHARGRAVRVPIRRERVRGAPRAEDSAARATMMLASGGPESPVALVAALARALVDPEPRARGAPRLRAGSQRVEPVPQRAPEPTRGGGGGRGGRRRHLLSNLRSTATTGRAPATSGPYASAAPSTAPRARS